MFDLSNTLWFILPKCLTIWYFVELSRSWSSITFSPKSYSKTRKRLLASVMTSAGKSFYILNISYICIYFFFYFSKINVTLLIVRWASLIFFLILPALKGILSLEPRFLVNLELVFVLLFFCSTFMLIINMWFMKENGEREKK